MHVIVGFAIAVYSYIYDINEYQMLSILYRSGWENFVPAI